MSRRRWRRRCRAKRSSGSPCRAWAITGGSVCWVHGGAAPQVRRAAVERLERDRFDRYFAHVSRRHEERLRAWWIDRVWFLADARDEDPMAVMTRLGSWEKRRDAWRLLPPGIEWPPGLRSEDEPPMAPDRRFGSRPRPAEACDPRVTTGALTSDEAGIRRYRISGGDV